MAGLTSAPRVSGTMRESPLYKFMSTGLTDRIFLIGHADGLSINDPYRVNSVQEAVNVMGADSESPLLRGLLEAYYGGARDIFLVSAGPMSEYIEDPADRNTVKAALGNKTFNQKYFERLQATYALLLEWDLPQWITPLEASFYNTGAYDFLTQLSTHCGNAFASTGNVRVGILGNRGRLNSSIITAMKNDARLATIGPNGKFVAVFVGEGLVNLRELPSTYSASMAATVAGELSSLRLNTGLTYHRLRNVVSPTHQDLSKADVDALAVVKLNVLVQTQLGKRGTPFQACFATDNTVATSGSDFWSLLQVRLVSRTMDRVRALGRQSIGTIGYGQFKFEVEDYLANLQVDDLIREYSLQIYRDESDRHKVYVDITLKPYFGVRDITFSVEVGPSEV